MRHEFTASTKKAARERANGVCEARGALYGLAPETRCMTILVAGNHEYDHYPLPAHAENSNTVENCVVVCKTHHSYKTANFDIPAEAKIKRVRKKYGLDPVTRKPGRKIQSPGFQPGHRPMQGRSSFQTRKP